MTDQTTELDPRSVAALRAVETEVARTHGDARAAVAAKTGRSTVDERLAGLLDEGSFQAIGALARLPEDFYRDLPESIRPVGLREGDGIVAGLGRIDGREVAVLAQDPAQFGGSGGPISGRISKRVVELARGRGIPLVFMLDGGGHRIQDGLDSRHFADTGQQFIAFSRMSGWVPMVAIVHGSGFAGNTNYAGLCDFVVMVEDDATMGIAGPALVKASIGESVTKEELGGPRTQVDRNGLAHARAESESAAFDQVRQFLSYLPANARTSAPTAAARDADPVEDFDGFVPTNSRRAYDMGKVVRSLVDADSFFEMQPTYARNLITGFARMDGRPIGVIANQPMFLAGTLDAPACEKSARFISLCDAYGIALLFLVDIPGFLVGGKAETSMLGRRSARILFELGRSTVPRVSVVVRKGYGLGFLAMASGRSFDADLALAWPTAEICAMNVDGAIEVAFGRKIAAADDPDAEREHIRGFFDSQVGFRQAAGGFGVDMIVAPSDTRELLVRTFGALPERRLDDWQPPNRGISPI